ncbi:MAG: hypothetical protein KatS3mg068_2249 [Candidatus Sericytochromatia bacterium]|nr:MAG: hypothetical protein KatS3mg068_2249 [Candidatus Sericytochromatia bacterium]
MSNIFIKFITLSFLILYSCSSNVPSSSNITNNNSKTNLNLPSKENNNSNTQNTSNTNVNNNNQDIVLDNKSADSNPISVVNNSTQINY